LIDELKGEATLDRIFSHLIHFLNQYQQFSVLREVLDYMDKLKPDFSPELAYEIVRAHRASKESPLCVKLVSNWLVDLFALFT